MTRNHAPAFSSRGYSLVGILITMAMIAVLMSISLTAMNKAVTGEGSQKEGTARTMQDQMQLNGMYQAFYVQSMENKGRFMVPSELAETSDTSVDTTANMYSAMVAGNYLSVKTLVSPNEYGEVYPDDDFNFHAVQPLNGVFWDPEFSADLQYDSNVSYAHLPLYGKRLRRQWKTTANMPLFGNRGPKDGIDDPNSWSYGRNGVWGGHIVYGDGRINFVHTFTPGQLDFMKDGESTPDNIFNMDEGPDGEDAILGFTKQMTSEGPVLDWD